MVHFKNLFTKVSLRSGILAIFILLFFSCGKKNTTEALNNAQIASSKTLAVVSTIASDYTSGAHSIVSYSAPRSVANDFLPTGSDVWISSYGKYFYRMEAYGANNITKFSVDDPSIPIWEFSTEGTETNSNPHSVVFVNDTKAYLIRYGSPKVWIINPSAQVESEFKIGEIDLSSYSNCDGTPEAASGIVTDGKLFIAMQRLCNWYPTQDAYIAVFDTSTDTEINTGMGSNGLKGIRLDIRNPFGKIKYYNGRIYVAGADGTLFGANNPIIGGIQSIDTTSYIKSSVIDPTAQITSLEIISDTKGYFVKYNATSNTSIISFNPSTGVISGVNTAGIGNDGHRNINSIIKDQDNMLWVADASLIKPGIYVVDPSTDTIQEGPLSTDLNPSEITFCER